MKNKVFLFLSFSPLHNKNKSAFVFYNTIQNSPRGSIGHQSSTDRKGSYFFLFVFLVFFFFFLLLFWGLLKKIRVLGNNTPGVLFQEYWNNTPGVWRVSSQGTRTDERSGKDGRSSVKKNQKKPSLLFYEEHFVQPHLTTFSTSWTKEDPSVHWKVYFLRLLRRGVQQVPCPSAPPGQLPRHSRRETFSWVWHAA